MLRLPEDRPDAWPALVASIRLDVRGELVLEAAADAPAVMADQLRVAGLTPRRRTQRWSIPVSVARLPHVAPDRHRLISVRDADLERVVNLDNALRDEIPGSSGWLGTVADLRAELSDDDFDPELYLVAEHASTGSYDGLVRVWNRRPTPRLGCVAVRSEWRRGRLTAALLGTVARVLAERGVPQVTAETDEENLASVRLARRVGAVLGPVDVEWVAPAR